MVVLQYCYRMMDTQIGKYGNTRAHGQPNPYIVGVTKNSDGQTLYESNYRPIIVSRRRTLRI